MTRRRKTVTLLVTRHGFSFHEKRYSINKSEEEVLRMLVWQMFEMLLCVLNPLPSMLKIRLPNNLFFPHFLHVFRSYVETFEFTVVCDQYSSMITVVLRQLLAGNDQFRARWILCFTIQFFTTSIRGVSFSFHSLFKQRENDNILNMFWSEKW